jgi:hypothetical protein
VPGARHTSLILTRHYELAIIDVMRYRKCVFASIFDHSDTIVAHGLLGIGMMAVEDNETESSEFGDNGCCPQFSHTFSTKRQGESFTLGELVDFVNEEMWQIN